MGNIYFNYKGKKYSICFFESKKTGKKACIINYLVNYHGGLIAHKARAIYYNSGFKLADLLKAL